MSDAPSVSSLHSWHVRVLPSRTTFEVNIVLTDVDQARVWATWLADKSTTLSGGTATEWGGVTLRGLEMHGE